MKPFWWWTQEQIDYYNELGEFFKSVAKEEGRTRYTREFPFHIFEEVGKKGFLGAAIPKEYGGLGLGATGSCMLAEQSHFISPGLGRIIVGDMNGGLRQIVEKGTEEQKKKFLPGIAAGETGAVVITEVSAGTDAAGIALTAEKKGGKYILRLNKSHNRMQYDSAEELDTDTRFRHNMHVGAAYASWRYKVGDVTLRGGVRYEYSHFRASYPNGDGEPFGRDLHDLVPSASVHWQMTPFNSLRLSWATSLNRPGIQYLNPAVKRYTSTIEYGNPHLSSARNNVVSLNFQHMPFPDLWRN